MENRGKTNNNRIGIEDEFILLENDPRQRGHAQKRLLQVLADQHGFRVVTTDPDDNFPLQVNKDRGLGYFCIKFDSTVNTIEIAHPPYASVEEAVASIAEIRFIIEKAAINLGLKTIYTGFKDFNLNADSFVQKGNIQKTIARPESQKPFFDRLYHGKICSTQVHLPLDLSSTFNILPRFYQLEPLIPIFFSNSKVAGRAHCLRLLLIQDGFEDAYCFFGFPKSLPKNETEYEKQKNAATGLFRDYSLVVPRSFGTWEFRSACCQPDIASIRNLLNFRVAAAEIVQSARTLLPFSHLEMRQIFREACIDPSQRLVQNYLHEAKRSGVFEKFVDRGVALNAAPAKKAVA